MFIDMYGYEDFFQVSKCGKVFSKRSNRLIKTTIGKTGYECFCTKLGGRGSKAVLIKVHRAVAETYLPNIDNKPVVNHKDGNKINNNIENLEWCTFQENTLHALSTGLIVPLKGEDKATVLTEDLVRRIRSMHVPNKIGKTKIAKILGVKPRTVAMVLLGEAWAHVK